MKKTQTRENIIQIFKKNKERFFSAEDIWNELNDTDIVTVYRNLKLFTEGGYIREIRLPNQKEAYYEYKDKDHHHIVCNTCSKVVHIALPQSVISQIKGLSHFDRDTLEITINGRCNK